MKKPALLALLTNLAALGLAHGAMVLQLNFTDGTDGAVSTPTLGGSIWNQMVEKNNAAPYPDIADLKDSANASSGISLTWNNGFHFASGNRGEGGTSTSGTTTDGLSSFDSTGVLFTDGSQFFPWSVIDSYGATHAGSDGYAAFTFASDAPLSYTFWIAASNDNNNPSETAGWNGLYNVGGTYTLASRSFAGGTTLALNGTLQQGEDSTADSTNDVTLKFSIGKLEGGSSQWNEVTGKYELTLQFGDGSSSTSAGVLANGIIVSVVPEPSTYALLGALAALGVGLRRRRRHAAR